MTAKKETIIQFFFAAAISFQLIFYHLPDEFRYSSFLLSLILISLFWIQNQSFLIPKKFFVFSSFFLLANIFSAFFSPNQYYSLIEIIKLTGLFLLAIIGANIFRKKDSFHRLYFIILLVAAFWALLGIVEYTGRHPAQKEMPLFEPFHWLSLAASFFLLTYPGSLYLFLKEKRGSLKKILLFSSTYLLGSAWILCQKYLLLQLLTSAIVIFQFFYLKLKNKQLLVIKEKGSELLLLVLLLLVTLPNFFPSFGDKLIIKEVALFQEKIIYLDKKDIWRFSRESVAKHFWQGIGPGNFAGVYRQNLVKPWTWSDFASNELLQTFLETGIAGFIIQFTLFSYLGSILIKKMLLYKRNNGFYLIISISALAFLLTNLNSFSLRIFPIAITVFFLFSMLLSFGKNLEVKPMFAYLILVPIGLLTLFIFSDAVLLMNGQKFYWQNQYPQSEELLSKLSNRPSLLVNPKVLFSLGIIKMETNQPREALLFFEKASLIDPNNQNINYQIAKIYSETEKSKSIDTLEENLKKNKFLPPEYYALLVKTYLEGNNQAQAKFWREKGMNTFPLPPTGPFLTIQQSILEYNNYFTSLEYLYSQP